MSRFAGRAAVVTGGGSGIGRAIAEALATDGAKVVIVDSDRSALDAVAGDAPHIECVRADVGSDDPAELAARVTERAGDHPSLVVNNAGVAAGKGFLDLDAGDLDRTLTVNLRGPWLFTRVLAGELIAAGRGGALLFISSLHSRVTRLSPDYGASKAAVVALVRELAHELGPKGLRVNAISPGAIDTWGADQAERERWAELVPQRRMGTPADIATVALALLDDAVSGYVNGADVAVDGGLESHTWLTQP